MSAKQIRVSGRVQDVFFRAHTKEMADALGVRGWVRNEQDGTVLIHAEGEPPALGSLIQWCDEGPSGADVTSVTTEDVAGEEYQSFTIQW